jgi:hypothetical protein
MTILRTAGEVQAFLATPLGREVEAILAPHLARLAEFELEDIAAIAVDETPPCLDPDADEYRTLHPGWTEEVFILSDDGFGWIVLTRN